MQIKECSVMDCSQLAVMNKKLIEDEKSTNPMGIEELEHRIKGFLAELWFCRNLYFYEISAVTQNLTVLGDVTDAKIFLRTRRKSCSGWN